MKRPLTGHIDCYSDDPSVGDTFYSADVRDTMILGRCKHGYHGGYPAGFLERARLLLVGGDQDAAIWHIPGGRAREYNGVRGGVNLSGFGKNDLTIDLDPECNPDICMDVRFIDTHFFPDENGSLTHIPSKAQLDLFESASEERILLRNLCKPKAIIIDRPYDEENADCYAPGRKFLPNLNKLLTDCLNLVDKGNLVGVLDYKWPNPSPRAMYEEVNVVSVGTGRGCNARWFTIWRKR
ncbi:hypothetical protein [Leptospira weilii]|nr:hypothetical protein [Leptospira weilii]